MKEPPPLRVLLVEDNPSDVVMFREALASAGLAVDLDVSWNGQEALDRLRRHGGQPAAARPDLVVLDVNLPILSGRELLAEMVADDTLNSIPVVVLTGSRFEKESMAMYPEDRCLFIVKPFDFQSLVEIVRRVFGFASSCRDASHEPRHGGTP
jgi:CheY-like chemotaxis protein